MFQYAVDHAKMPLCYNGNLNSEADIAAIAERFPSVDAVMIGRGLIADPGMLTSEGTSRDTLEAFLQELADTYCIIFGSKRNAIYRLKDNWHYLITLFEGSEKHWKELRKCTDYDRFCAITHEIIHTLPMKSTWEPSW
jgi:tRNA-dihydrouridine synthase